MVYTLAMNADWLRSEIEKLEKEIEHWKKHSAGNYAQGAIEALTSIITRYKEELKELIGE